MDVVVFFFLLGLFARVVKSDLRLPEALYETLTLYLLLAIGLKGGLELSRQAVGVLAPQVLVLMGLGALIPLLVTPLLRLAGLRGVDAAGLAAHYGSVSVVTFAVGLTAVQRAGLPFEAHAPLWVAVMEAPGLVVGIVFGAAGLAAGKRPDPLGLAGPRGAAGQVRAAADGRLADRLAGRRRRRGTDQSPVH